jgi:hypothetical protein
MPKVLTISGSIRCSHQGKASLMSEAKLTVNGNAVLLQSDYAQWMIPDCTQKGGSVTPCTNIASLSAGFAGKLTVGGVAVLLDTLAGQTNGAPPGTLSASEAQDKLTAV